MMLHCKESKQNQLVSDSNFGSALSALFYTTFSPLFLHLSPLFPPSLAGHLRVPGALGGRTMRKLRGTRGGIRGGLGVWGCQEGLGEPGWVWREPRGEQRGSGVLRQGGGHGMTGGSAGGHRVEQGLQPRVRGLLPLPAHRRCQLAACTLAVSFPVPALSVPGLPISTWSLTGLIWCKYLQGKPWNWWTVMSSRFCTIGKR